VAHQNSLLIKAMAVLFDDTFEFGEVAIFEALVNEQIIRGRHNTYREALGPCRRDASRRQQCASCLDPALLSTVLQIMQCSTYVGNSSQILKDFVPYPIAGNEEVRCFQQLVRRRFTSPYVETDPLLVPERHAVCIPSDQAP
jgi:hypothetical protein